MSKKSRKVFFPSRDLAMSPRGGLTRGRTAEGRPSPGEQSLGTGVPTHTPGPPLSNRVPPPTETRLNCSQMTLPPLQMLPQPSPRKAWPMTAVRRWFLYAPAVEPEQDRVWDVRWPTTLRGT